MAPWCIHISCLERVARSGSGLDSVRGLVGAMDAELSRPDWLATVQSGRKQVQSRVCTPSLRSPSLAVAGEHRKRHAMRAHKPQAVSDWLNPHSLGTMSAFGYIELSIWPKMQLV